MQSTETVDSRHDASIDPAKVLAIYRAMVRARMLDERIASLVEEGRVGFGPRSVFGEACSVGAAAALRDQDWIFPDQRQLGALLYRGVPVQVYVDHVFGNAGDPAKGRQMPGGFTGRPWRIASVGTPRGQHLSHGAGLGWAARVRGEDAVAAVLFGEAVVASNDFHTALNFAGVFRSSAVFLCRTDHSGVADKAVAYGIASARCDGDDALAVYKTVRAAIARAARGEGATLVEMLVPPKKGNGDTEARDPIARLRRHLESSGAWDGPRDAALAEEIASEIDRAVDAAAKKARPAPGSLLDDVFAEREVHLHEQARELERD